MATSAAGLQQLYEPPRRKSANAVTVDVYGCYSGMREGAYLIIAEPGDRDLFRHLNVAPLALHKGAKRRQIGHESDDFRIGPPLEQGHDSRASMLYRDRRHAPRDDTARSKAKFVERACKALATLFAARVSCRRPADITEPAVALRGKRRNEQAHRLLIRESDDLIDRFRRKIPSLDHRNASRT